MKEEVGPQGLYPEQSAQLESIAKTILPYLRVELATHTYSHPFNWDKAENTADARNEATDTAKSYHLPIKGYTFNLDREIQGSIDYINQRLAPPNKHVKVLCGQVTP